MRVLAAITVLFLAGCAAPYTWERPGGDPAFADRQREIDTANCEVAATHEVPLPEPVQTPTASPSHYSVDGTTTAYGPNGEVTTGYYSGTATETAQRDGVADGAAFVQNLTDHANAVKLRTKLADACMLERGWVRAPRK